MKITLNTTKNARKKSGNKYPYIGILDQGQMSWVKPRKLGNTVNYTHDFTTSTYGVAGNQYWDFDSQDWERKTVWFYADKRGIQILASKQDLIQYLANIQDKVGYDSSTVPAQAVTRVVPDWLVFMSDQDLKELADHRKMVENKKTLKIV